MKIAIKLILFCTFFTFLSFNSLSQSCSDGSYAWSDAAAIFESNGCATASCHGGGASGLDLTSYDGFNAGGINCTNEISAGTTLVDIIVNGGVTCADGDVMSSMNSFIASPVSQSDLDDLQAWIDEGSFEFCPGTPLDDGVCSPTTTVDNLADPGQATLCNDGSDAPTFAAPSGSLPDVQIVVEVNGELIVISDDGSFDTSILNDGDEVCYTAFTFDLVAINDLLSTAALLCPVVDCDMTFDLVGVNQAVADLVAGGGLMDLNDALDFAGSFGNPIESAQSAGSTLDALNVQIGGLLGNVCYATSERVCLSVVTCGGPNTCPTVYLNDDNLPSLPEALCVGDLLELCFDIAVDEALFDANSIEFNYELLIGGSPATVALTNSYSSGTAIDANATGQICFSATIPAGSNACESFELSLEIQTVFYRDADCPDDFVAYDLFLTSPLALDQEGENLNTLVPLLAIAGLNPILVQVYPTPDWTATVTQAPACDGSTLGIVEINAGDGTLCETVTDLGTFGADGECPANNAELPEYTYTAFETFIVPDENDMDSIVVNPCAIEVIVPAQTINCTENCGPCEGEEVAITFSVDMSCSGTTLRPPVVTGPFNGFSGDGNIMIDPDGDDIWEAVICAVPGTTFEYKYAIQDFVEQENLVDDAIGGANGVTCDLNTNFFDFSNRLITIPDATGALPTDGYGICGSCDDPPVSVTFSVNMNCSDVDPGTPVAMFGGFNGFCCPYGLQDADGDNVWTTTLPFPTDDSGCISMQYLYMSPDFSNVESFLTNGEDIANCPNIFSDFNEFANRIIEVCEDVVLDEYWNSCSAPEEPAGGCDDGDCANGLETWDGCECISGEPGDALGCTDPAFCEYDPNANCDDGSCVTSNADPGTCNTDCTIGDIQDWDSATCTCVSQGTPVLGCTDPTASNFDEAADCDDDSCIFTIVGCTDPCAPNFNPDAEEDDDTCEDYSTTCNTDCTMGDITVWDAATCGCVVSVATVLGCTDALACNFDATANCNEGCDFGNTACPDPCNEPNPDDGCDLTVDSFDAVTCTVTNEADCPDGTDFDIANCQCISIPVDGCTDPCDPAFNPDSTNDNLCEGYNTECNSDCTMGDIAVWDATTCSCVVSVTTVLGCTDVTACNFDPAANCDDPANPCNFGNTVCADPCNEPDIDDGCDITIDSFDAATCTVINDPDCPDGTIFNAVDCLCDTDCVQPPEPSTECYQTATFNEEACMWEITGDPPVVDDGCEFTDDSFDPVTCAISNISNCPDGTNLVNCECTNIVIEGCTDPCAPNYNPDATVEDGSCQPYDRCPENECLTEYTWDPETCNCSVADLVEPDCNDNDECTIDSFDLLICECVNEPIANCICTPPTPGTIDCE